MTHHSKEENEMNINDYQLWTRSTAIYPSEQAVEYLALGLASEAGEVAWKIKKWIRDGNLREKEIISELGDCLWYIARLADEYGVTISQLATENHNKLASRKERGTLTGSGDNR